MPLARLVFLITVSRTRNATLPGHAPKASLIMDLIAHNVLPIAHLVYHQLNATTASKASISTL